MSNELQALRADATVTQTVTMTARLQQAIELLPMPAQELHHFLQTHMEENPFLEIPQEDTYTDTPSDDSIWDMPTTSGARASYDADPLEKITTTVTLKEHLLQQIDCQFTTLKDRTLAHYITDHLDDDGYLRVPTAQLAKDAKRSTNDVQALIHSLQHMADPTGVYAQTITECLALQLKERGLYNKDWASFLEHIECLSSSNLHLMSKKTGMDTSRITDMLSTVRTLNPKPGLAFISSAGEGIMIDAIIEKQGRDDWRISLNPHLYPALSVNMEYANRCRHSVGKSEKNFITERIQHAQWIHQALTQRAKTLRSVLEELICVQEAFLFHGTTMLKPLTLMDIATKLGVHESTVSRITSHKFIMTPHGVFSLKYFFCSKRSKDGDKSGPAATAIKARIASIIQHEDLKKPLSDEKIAQMLSEEGINIARRTATKYREALAIPTASMRKRKNQLKAQT